jgi:hypothetical protein
MISVNVPSSLDRPFSILQTQLAKNANLHLSMFRVVRTIAVAIITCEFYPI